MREKLTAKHPRNTDARRAPVRPGAPRKPMPDKAPAAKRAATGDAPRTRSTEAAGARKPRLDAGAPRRPRADGDAPRKPRSDADAPRRPRADGDAPRKPRFDADAPRRPRADGDAPRKPRFDADAPRRPRADGDAPRKPRFDADAPRRPRADGDAPRKPRFDADAPRRPRADGDAPRKPRFDADAPRRPRADGDAPRKPRSDADAPRRPRADGDAPRKPRFDADAPRRPRADGDAPRKPRFDADAPRRPRADGDAPRKPRSDADAPRRSRTETTTPAPTRRVVTNTTGAPRRSHEPSARDEASPARSPRARAAAHAPEAQNDHDDIERGDEAGMLRLSKRMSELGLCSRREADEWIEKGWVLVDGQRIDTLGTKVRPEQHIEIMPAARQQQANLVTILIHKPVGYVSGQPEDDYLPAAALITAETQWADDESGIRFAPLHLRSLAPAGRLDIDSTGLLVMTQDGRVARQLIGADSDVDKEYLVRVSFNGIEQDVSSAFPADRLALLCHGLSLDDEALRPAQVEWQNPEQLRFVLRQGKKRQIRRMCELVGLEVVGLKRVRIGNVMLGNLPQGQWRYLRPGETFGDIA